jgi:hypothetical protein
MEIYQYFYLILLDYLTLFGVKIKKFNRAVVITNGKRKWKVRKHINIALSTANPPHTQ